ncbi:MAG TPA: leucyl aminopeptidase, partial [Gammaproteobacteria bacterium]|nr:leucyl aminopeptidase [Gammaproteobacteria bacterium]
MEYTVKSGDPEKQRSGCVVIGLFEGRKLAPAGKRLDEAAQGALAAFLRRGDIDGKSGQSLMLHNPPNLLCERLLFIGCGREKEFHEGRYRDAATLAARTLASAGASEAVSYLTELEVKGRDIAWNLRHAVECTEAALYKFDRMKSRKSDKKQSWRKLVLTVGKRSELAIGETAVHQ